MQLSVCRRYRFEAAHTLPWHAGKCSRVHGHSYVLEVCVRGDLDERGVVLEFSDLDAIVDARVIARVDHVDLNLLLPNPTAENLVLWIGDQLAALSWQRLALWETENGWVELKRP